MVGAAFPPPDLARTPSVPPSRATRTRPAGLATAKASPLAALASRYDLEGTVTGFQPLTEGLMNRNYRITTSAGDWFLKHYLDAGPRQIALQHQVTTALAGVGLPVPTPLRARSGATLVTAKGRHFALYPWITGWHRRGLELPLVGCAALGRLLGRLHTELGRILPPIQQTLLVPTASVAGTLARIDALLGLVRALPAPGGFDELAERRLVQRRGLLVELAGLRPPEADTLLVGHVHGDFHALNLLYADQEQSEPVAILDWDRLGVRPYTTELVRAATLLFGYDDERGLDLARVGVFVDAYRHAFPWLAAGEIRSAVHRLWWERLCDFWMLEWRYQRGDRTCDHLFAGAAALVAWWTSRRERVLDAFATR
jgi:Ser/Thr protein kinase RdoA (MazF antagonist)